MNLNVCSHNLYTSLADLNIDDEEDHKTVTSTSNRMSVDDTPSIHEDEEEEYDEEDDIIHALFDLEALGRHTERPAFTRGLLQKIASDICSILTIQKGLNRERENSFYWKGSNGPSARIWKEVDGANDVTVNYMTRVEMSSQFQTLFGKEWKRSKLFRALNTNLSQHQLNKLAAPYYLESFRRAPDNTHLDAEEMDWWRDRLSHTYNLWENSPSCIQLCHMVRQGAARLRAPITKIVCIGIGELDSSPAFYQSAVQHMTAFSFAEALDAFNRTAHPECPPVTIIAQDPCYKACDRILLQELTKTQIDFSLSDPETLLSIDANTLVITAFLPHTVPLMQILADLFVGQLENGPAMILGDRIVNPGGRTKWCFRNRDQPGVAKFLIGGYTLWPTEFVGVDEELRKDLCCGKKIWEYWLRKMMFCLRRDVVEVKKA
jgi:hypothetical protein